MFFALSFLSASRQHHSEGRRHHGQRDEVPNASGSQIYNKAAEKLGCPYVYGAAGPNSFDCSGLVMWTHAQFGISLPRVASAQANSGRGGSGAIGDVVAFGNPAYHVGICRGDGWFVHAPKPGDKVKLTELRWMDSNRRFRRFY